MATTAAQEAASFACWPASSQETGAALALEIMGAVISRPHPLTRRQ